MRAGRKDHTLLRDDQLQESLLDNVAGQDDVKKERATVFRLLALAKKEVWVCLNFFQAPLQQAIRPNLRKGRFRFMGRQYNLQCAAFTAGHCCAAGVLPGDNSCSQFCWAAY